MKHFGTDMKLGYEVCTGGEIIFARQPAPLRAAILPFSLRLAENPATASKD